MTDVTVTLPPGALPPEFPDGVGPTVEVTGITLIVNGAGTPGDAVTHEELDEHINAVEPHPSYDDMPDLSLLFQNGLI